MFALKSKLSVAQYTQVVTETHWQIQLIDITMLCPVWTSHALFQAWKEIPSKLIQELDDIKLQLKTEASAIRPPEDVPGLPTIPCASLFALHVQQLEQGGFTLANGMYRWPKLRYAYFILTHTPVDFG